MSRGERTWVTKAEKQSPTRWVRGSGGQAWVFSSFPVDERLKFSNDALTKPSETQTEYNEW